MGAGVRVTVRLSFSVFILLIGDVYCIVYVCQELHTSVTVRTALEQECSGEYNTYTLGKKATIHQVSTMQ